MRYVLRTGSASPSTPSGRRVVSLAKLAYNPLANRVLRLALALGSKKPYPRKWLRHHSKVGLCALPDELKGTLVPLGDQWTVVTSAELAAQVTGHRWRMVTLRNRAGQLSAGLQCVDCDLVERVTDRQLRSHGTSSRRDSR